MDRILRPDAALVDPATGRMDQNWYDFFARQFSPPQLLNLTYSTSIAPDAARGSDFVITATDGVAFTIAAPANPVNGKVITFTVRNASGGALGAITWNAVFKMPAFTAPANGFSRSVTFHFNGTNWVQRYQSAADVPN